MAKLTAAERDKLPDSAFAYIDSKGNRALPIHDAVHTRDAMSRWSQTDFESPAKKASAKAKILAAAKKFGIDVTNFANPLADIFDNLAKKVKMGVVHTEVDFTTTIQYESTLV